MDHLYRPNEGPFGALNVRQLYQVAYTTSASLPLGENKQKTGPPAEGAARSGRVLDLALSGRWCGPLHGKGRTSALIEGFSKAAHVGSDFGGVTWRVQHARPFRVTEASAQRAPGVLRADFK